MPKKPIDKIRVPLNCLIAPVTKEAITGLQNETRESQGEIVDRAVALLAFGEEIGAPERKKEDDVVLSDVAKVPVVEAGARLPVESWRRGPRQKGDKTR